MDKEFLNSSEDVDAILKLAIQRSGGGVEDELRERLQRSAEELGISQDQLDGAIEEYKTQKKIGIFQLVARRTAFNQLVTSIGINAGLVVIWAVTGRSFPWPVFPIMFYLLPTAYNYFRTKRTLDRSDPEFQEWLRAGEPNTWSSDPDERRKHAKA